MSKPQRDPGFPNSGLQTVVQAVEMPFEIGEIIGGKYEVINLIGSGGMGFVVAANHIELGDKVALKFLRREAMANAEIVGRFAREARASVKIKSEYVARVFDVGSLDDGSPFIVMEHLEGKDLYEVVHETGALPITTAVEYVMQVCEALAVAHANGVVHRDIKPENLFLTRRAQGMDIIKVLDFGISKVALTGSAFDIQVPLIRTMMPVGSPVYMSPEQIRASKDIDARTDIWSLGCVLFELITGQAPFDAPSLTQLSATILEGDPPALRLLLPDAPADLEAVIVRCLHKDPARRFQNVGELAIALYPFAPRRARISAERSVYVLKDAGIFNQPYVLPSISPAALMPAETTTIDEPSPSLRGSSHTAQFDETMPPRRTGWVVPAIAASLLLIAATYYVHTHRAAIAAQSGWGPEALSQAPAARVPTTPAPAQPVSEAMTAYEIPGAPTAAATPRAPAPPPAGKPKGSGAGSSKTKSQPAQQRPAREPSNEPDPGF